MGKITKKWLVGHKCGRGSQVLGAFGVEKIGFPVRPLNIIHFSGKDHTAVRYRNLTIAIYLMKSIPGYPWSENFFGGSRGIY